MPISCKKEDDLSGRSFFGVEYDLRNPFVITDGSTSDTNRNHCTARGWITRDTFLPHMQRTTLKIRVSTAKLLTDFAMRIGRVRLRDNIIGSLRLHMGLPGQLCLNQSSERKTSIW